MIVHGACKRPWARVYARVSTGFWPVLVGAGSGRRPIENQFLKPYFSRGRAPACWHVHFGLRYGFFQVPFPEFTFASRELARKNQKV